jgi:Cell wall-active antibiotics response 4TMS YvqF
MSEQAASGRTEWHVNLMGGMKPPGPWRMAARTVFVSLIGGAALDVTQATLAGPEAVFTKVSLIGGLHVRVPKGMRVQVSSFVLFGSRTVIADPNADGPLLRLRSFGLFGGVRVSTDGL